MSSRRLLNFGDAVVLLGGRRPGLTALDEALGGALSVANQVSATCAEPRGSHARVGSQVGAGGNALQSPTVARMRAPFLTATPGMDARTRATDRDMETGTTASAEPEGIAAPAEIEEAGYADDGRPVRVTVTGRCTAAPIGWSRTAAALTQRQPTRLETGVLTRKMWRSATGVLGLAPGADPLGNCI